VPFAEVTLSRGTLGRNCIGPVAVGIDFGELAMTVVPMETSHDIADDCTKTYTVVGQGARGDR
jgi:hypothetical protein